MQSSGMYIKETSQQTFEILNNNLDVRFDKAYQNQDCKTIKYYKQIEQDKPRSNGKVAKCNSSDAKDTFQTIPGLSSCAVISTLVKYFKT